MPGRSNASATILDVARLSGFARTTVSNALNGKGRVNEETRLAITKAARELGYRPSRVARALRTSHTRTLALVLPVFDGSLDTDARSYSDFYMRMLSAAAAAAIQHGCQLLVSPELRSQQEAADLVVDGALVVDPPSDVDRIGWLIDAGIPVVTYERDNFRPESNTVVMTDNVTNIRALLDHFWSTGARRVAMVIPSATSFGLLESRQAYEAWCVERGLATRLLEVNSPWMDNATQALSVELGRDDAPDAVLDLVPPSAIRAARQLGLLVPEQLRVATYVDGPDAWSSQPALTAMDLDAARIGRSGIELLVQAMEGSAVEPVTVSAILRVRHSSEASE